MKLACFPGPFFCLLIETILKIHKLESMKELIIIEKICVLYIEFTPVFLQQKTWRCITSTYSQSPPAWCVIFLTK